MMYIICKCGNSIPTEKSWGKCAQCGTYWVLDGTFAKEGGTMFKNLLTKFGRTFAYVAVGSVFAGVGKASGMIPHPSDPILGMLSDVLTFGVSTAATAVATRVMNWDPTKLVK